MTATKKYDQGKASRAEYVYAAVRDAIHQGRYGPGSRIRETEVAERLGVSRTPVREALRRLQADGLLTFAPWRGVEVSTLDRQQVIELYAMREVLEGAAARMAAQHVSSAEISLLRGLLERERAQCGNAEKLAENNRLFHQLLYAAAHNHYLTQSLNALRNSLALLRGTTFAQPGRASEAHNEHRALVEAIAERDADKAEQAARAHIEGAGRARLSMLVALDD